MCKFTLAINAGGKSSRMGTDKAFLTIGDKMIIERIIERTKDLGQAKTILVTNQPEQYTRFGLKIVSDVYPDKGSLGGIYSAIQHSSQPYTLMIACDMPFVSADLLRYMVSLIADADIIVPRVENYPEGLHAIYSKACLAAIKPRLEANQLKVTGFYEGLKIRYLDEAEYQEFDPRGIAFMNVNSPEDLEQARKLAASAD